LFSSSSTAPKTTNRRDSVSLEAKLDDNNNNNNNK
jgi:hypothetical protein